MKIYKLIAIILIFALATQPGWAGDALRPVAAGERVEEFYLPVQTAAQASKIAELAAKANIEYPEAVRPKGSDGKPGGLLEIGRVKRIIHIGDLHGQYNHLAAILKDRNNMEAIRRGEAHLICTGDIIHPRDRSFLNPAGYQGSIDALFLLMRLKAEFPSNVHILMGSHEFGQVFGVHERLLVANFRQYVTERFSPDVYEKVAAFIKGLPIAVISTINNKTILFAHHPAILADARDKTQLIDIASIKTPEEIRRSLNLTDSDSGKISEALRNIGVDIVVNGHFHFTRRRSKPAEGKELIEKGAVVLVRLPEGKIQIVCTQESPKEFDVSPCYLCLNEDNVGTPENVFTKIGPITGVQPQDKLKQADSMPEFTAREVYEMQNAADFGSPEYKIRCIKLVEERLVLLSYLIDRLNLPESTEKYPVDEEGNNIPTDALPNMLQDVNKGLQQYMSRLLKFEDVVFDLQNDDTTPKESLGNVEASLKNYEADLVHVCNNYLTNIQTFLIYLGYSDIAIKMSEDKLGFLCQIYEVTMQTFDILQYFFAYAITPLNITDALKISDIDLMDIMRRYDMNILAANLAINSNLFGTEHIAIRQASKDAIVTILGECVKNILANSIHANTISSESPTIDVRLELKDNKAQFAISNNNVNMDPKKLKMAMVPGVTEKKEMQRVRLYWKGEELPAVFGGFGLGLPKILHYCRFLGAEVEIYAKSGGRTWRCALDENFVPQVTEADNSEIEFMSGFKVVITFPDAYSKKVERPGPLPQPRPELSLSQV